eukprot:augustus_masked-scaffold_1-processed-gene-21.5-mRNA-1 protein AED:1.00 eAED:1.00 QI:0/0/0/0/1/1/3/0/556
MRLGKPEEHISTGVHQKLCNNETQKRAKDIMQMERNEYINIETGPVNHATDDYQIVDPDASAEGLRSEWYTIKGKKRTLDQREADLQRIKKFAAVGSFMRLFWYYLFTLASSDLPSTPEKHHFVLRRNEITFFQGHYQLETFRFAEVRTLKSSGYSVRVFGKPQQISSEAKHFSGEDIAFTEYKDKLIGQAKMKNALHSFSGNLSTAQVDFMKVPQSILTSYRSLSDELWSYDEVKNKPTPVVIPPSEKNATALADYPDTPLPLVSTEIKLDLYIELLVINDIYRLVDFDYDMEAMATQSEAVVNQVNSFFTEGAFPGANIQVVLSGQLIFEEDNLGTGATVDGDLSFSADILIESLNSFRNTYLETLHSHDVAHLFSGMDFTELACEDLEPGYCFYDGATGDFTNCCLRWAGAINMVDDSLIPAATVAHEIGHQLGFCKHIFFIYLAHDNSQGCGSGKVMDATSTLSTTVLERTWSSCSHAKFETLITSENQDYGMYNYHGYVCLLNQPDTLETSNDTVHNGTLTPTTDLSVAPISCNQIFVQPLLLVLSVLRIQ